MSHPLKEFKGNTLYLDTMVFYALLRGLATNVRTLFTEIKTGNLQAYTSTLTFDELADRMVQTLTHEKYTDAAHKQWGQHRTNLFAEFYPKILPPMTLLRNFPNLTLLDVSAIDLMLMSENMGRYLLSPRAALHMAAMQKIGCFNLLSQDMTFDCIQEIRRYTLT